MIIEKLITAQIYMYLHVYKKKINTTIIKRWLEVNKLTKQLCMVIRFIEWVEAQIRLTLGWCVLLKILTLCVNVWRFSKKKSASTGTELPSWWSLAVGYQHARRLPLPWVICLEVYENIFKDVDNPLKDHHDLLTEGV